MPYCHFHLISCSLADIFLMLFSFFNYYYHAFYLCLSVFSFLFFWCNKKSTQMIPYSVCIPQTSSQPSSNVFITLLPSIYTVFRLLQKPASLNLKLVDAFTVAHHFFLNHVDPNLIIRMNISDMHGRY